MSTTSEWSVKEPGKLTFDEPVTGLRVRIVNGTVNVGARTRVPPVWRSPRSRAHH